MSRLFIYTSKRPGSHSSTILDRLARENDVKFRVWEWELFGLYDKAVELKYSLQNPNPEQQELYAKIKSHKEWLDTFDEIFVGCAMHNFGINVNFKTYTDVLFQSGIGFAYESGKVVGLLRNIPWNFVVAGGGHYLETEGDLVIPWIKAVMKFCGVTNVKHFAVKGTLRHGFDINTINEVNFTE